MGRDLTYTDGVGVLLLFQVAPGTNAQLKMESGDYTQANYRVWGFTTTDTTWEFGTGAGENGKDYQAVQSTDLQQNHWYYLLLRIRKDGHVSGFLWHKESLDNPVAAARDVLRTNADWSNLSWHFTFQVYAGAVKLASYTEFGIPDKYVIANQLDADLIK